MANGSVLQNIMNPPGANMPERLSDLKTARSARTAQNLQNAQTQVDMVGRSAQSMLDSFYPEGSEQPTNPTQAAQTYFQTRKRLIDSGVPANSIPEKVPTRSELEQARDQALSVKEQLALNQEPQRMRTFVMGGKVIQEDPETGELSEQFTLEEPIEVKEEVPAINQQTGNRETLVRTNRGLARQSRHPETGEAAFEMVDSQNYRVVRTEEAGTTEELGLTEERDLRNAEVSTKEFISTTQDALELLSEEKNINTWTAKAGAIVNDIQQEANAIATTMGDDVELFNTGQYQDTFDDLGIQNRRMKSLLVSLGYQLARSREEGRLSDTDVRLAIESLGGSATDPRALSQTLRDVAQRTARRFRTNYETRKGEPYEGSLGEENLPDIDFGAAQEFTEDNPAKPTTDEEYKDLPSGAIYEHPEDGKLYEKP